MTKQDRRGFLETAAAGIFATSSRFSSHREAGPSLSVSERQRLIEKAHFGRKSVATSKSGMAIAPTPSPFVKRLR